jgi:hypothetical protein
MRANQQLRVSPSPGSPLGLCGLLSRRNTSPRRVSPVCSALAWAVGGLAMLLVPIVAMAQTGTVAALEAPLLDRTHVTLAYGWVGTWTKRGSAEERPEDGAALPGMLPPSVPVSGCLGVRVTLRKGGVTMGVGDVVYDDATEEAASGQVRDLVEVTREATTIALKAVDQSLSDAHLKAVIAPPRPVPGRQASPPQRLTLEQIGPELLVDVQVAHRRASIRIGRMEEYHALFRGFAPGFHGLILKAEDAEHASWLWPASALASNTNPRSQVVQLLAEQGLRADDLVKVARPGGPTLDRYEVIHMVQPTQSLRPRVLTRGSDPLPPISLSRKDVDALAAAMAKHLERRISPLGAVAGTYQPTSDTYDPANAPDDERALVLFSLMQWTNAQPSVSRPGTPQHALSQRVATAATDLAGVLAREDVAVDPAAVALTLLTLVDSKAVGDRKPSRDALAARLMAMRDANGYFVQRDGERMRAPNHPTQAIMAASLVAMYDQTRQPEYADAANHNLTALWNTQQQTTQITSLPWLLSAELRLIRLGAERGVMDDATRLAKYEYLGDLVDRLCRRQIVEPPALGPDDVVGGFDLTGGAPMQIPVADWRSAFVLAFVAEALRTEVIAAQPGRDRLGWMLTCGLTARFLSLLTFDESGCYYVRSKLDAVGGVRLAFWDNRLPAVSTAMSLIAMTQLQETLADAEGMPVQDAPDADSGMLDGMVAPGEPNNAALPAN